MKKIAFTIVLNGMPFIKKQYEIIPKIFDKWYIVEGVVSPVLDTSWCRNIPKKYYSDNFLSIDGTSDFLDSIISDKITVIRKNDYWTGKVEMCNSFMSEVQNSILMEFDVDEIWDPFILKDVLKYSEENDYFDGMLFKCNYHVGPNLVIKNENCYGNNPNEWCRLWKIDKQTHWISHEPPRLKGCLNFLTRNFTKNQGWTFDHYAYILEDQLKFKEEFYGYKNAFNQWKRLQLNTQFPCYLRDYLGWVHDNSLVDIKTV
jgi:hypothetical protein